MRLVPKHKPWSFICKGKGGGKGSSADRQHGTVRAETHRRQPTEAGGKRAQRQAEKRGRVLLMVRSEV